MLGKDKLMHYFIGLKVRLGTQSSDSDSAQLHTTDPSKLFVKKSENLQDFSFTEIKKSTDLGLKMRF